MCEFTVKLGGEVIAEDVLYLEVTEEGVVLRDVMGEEQVIEGAQVKRIDMDEHVVELER
ncbi:CooT family nickel-binding protein [Methanopyrus kandleri]|uniref:Predicted RNA-binding protein n=2 Tax=Methanopyrus kandleri TaxID=2320 RepID=Q8TXE0_METKA|nr:CooT family nickel-binding protein [Methanopyrus kandleri]AAM01948.1 Predicted RNA-binding protein [Methanopyrus kandleri AV19]HII70039.1 CooT family nickel-binding protein [Methanopyrus kandleri]